MTRLLLMIMLAGSVSISYAQDSKRLWAKSFLNKKAPELVVEKWINKKPDTEGKFILIDFWATWCNPCKKLIPDLNDYQEMFEDDLIVVGLSDESETKLKVFNSQIEYYHATDSKKRTKNIYQVKGIPHTVLIDPNGVVRWEGYPLLNEFELTETIIENIISEYKITNNIR